MSRDEQNALQRKQQGYLARTDKPAYTPPTSLTEAVARPHRAISVVRQTRGDELIMWVKSRLIRMFTYLGCFEKVTDYQVKTLAQRICDKYYHLTPTELDYFFVAFTNGEYRRLYSTSTVNPQDIMMSLIDYERDVLAARGEAEAARQREEARQKEAEEAKTPHGWQAWEIYCKENGLDPNTHRIKAFAPKNVNNELNNNNKQKE